MNIKMDNKVLFIIGKLGMVIEANNKSYPIHGSDGKFYPFESIKIDMEEIYRLQLIINEIIDEHEKLEKRSTPCVGGWI